MAVSIESFLVLEQSLATRITNAWTRDTATTRRKIIEAVNAGDFATAVDLCDGLGLGAAAERNRKYAEFVGMQALLYGASRLSGGNPKRTVFSGKRKPEEVEQATEILMQTLADSGTLAVCRLADELLLRERANQQDEAYKSERRKAATSGFIRGFQSAVNSNGKAYINIGSSLHNSRLSAWGFTQEANFRGISEYQVSEQLDSRTCPVCQAMNGRKFTVAPAQQKLEKWLGTTDAKELASIAKWPSQSKANVAAMRGMSSDQLAQRGWDTPPYHPLCRGVLVPAGTLRVTRPIPQQRPVDAPEENVNVQVPKPVDDLDQISADLNAIDPPERIDVTPARPDQTKIPFTAATQADVDGMYDFLENVIYPGEKAAIRSQSREKLTSNYGGVEGSRITEHAKLTLAETEALLTQDEIAAMWSYTDTGFRQVNGMLGGWRKPASETSAARLEGYARVLDNAMEKLPKYGEATTWRGMDVSQDVIDINRELHQVGRTVNYNYFMSTSSDEASAFGGNFRLVVRGKSGRSTTNVSEYGIGENEVLFRPGANFKVLDVEGEGRNLTVYLEEVDSITKAELTTEQLSWIKDAKRIEREQAEKGVEFNPSPTWKDKMKIED